MDRLRQHFITADSPFAEGRVDVFCQSIWAEQPQTATLLITALGVYEARLNGQKVGDVFLAPGFTYYPRDLHVQKYTVQLAAGENTLTVYLGQGWYCGRFTFENKVQIWGENPAVAWLLETAGAVHCSAPDTVQQLESPYEYAGLYDGEIYRADILRPTGKTPLAYTGPLPEVFEESPCALRLREQMPVRAVTVRDGVTILDFGQNFAGVISIDPAKMDGDALTLRHGEILNADGSLYTANLRKARATLVYRKGTDTTPYTPKFTYMGFRYAELTGCSYVPGLVSARALYSDMRRTGHFACENQKVQQLYHNQVWGQKSNYVEVPTDCPQRDERMGYTGDGHVFARTGAYNFDTRAFWRKFLKDIRYSQLDNSQGYIPSTLPATGPAGIGFLSMLGWGNAITIIPQVLYEQYGDESFLRDNYDSMRAFVDCECRKCRLTGLWIGPSLGDWLALGRDVKYMAMHNGPVSNAFVVHDLEFMSRLAARLGREEDAARYARQLQKTHRAYLAAYVKKDGTMKDDYQGAYVMALQHVIPRGPLWDAVYARLLARIARDGMQTGFFATQHLLPLLADNGQAKLAYDLLLQPGCPGWMYQVDRGATTTWERWDALLADGTVNETKMADDNMVSFNHYAFGSVGEFYYRYILGIRPGEPGYKTVHIQPFFDERLGAVEGSYDSVAGQIRVAWQLQDGKVTLQLTTPTKTLLTLPGGQETLAPGSYERAFTV